MEFMVMLAVVLGGVPLLGCLLWWWNDIFYGLLVKIRCSSGGTKLPPGHMGLPFFGEILTFLWYFRFLRRPDDFINSKRHKYGEGVGMYRTHLFGSPGVIVISPTIMKFILKLEREGKVELYWPTIELMGTNSLVGIEGAAHSRIRNLVIKAINQPDALKIIGRMVQTRIISSLQSWTAKPSLIAYDEVKKVIFENIGKFFVGFEHGPVLDTLKDLVKGMNHGMRANPVNIPGTAYHHGLQCRKRAIAIFREELEKRKKKYLSGCKTVKDLMDELMQCKDDEGKHLSEVEVLDNIVTLFIGGYESTSLAIMWAIYYLAKYPNVLHKLREENLPPNLNKNGDLITSVELFKLKYTNKVVEETIRMANVASFVSRSAKEDVEFKGYKIPKGWKVILWLRYLHTNPENFQDPFCFNPDRWNEPAKPGTFLAFGRGRRICAGNMLARMQVAIFLHHLAIGYKWELINPDAEISCLPHPKPIDGVEIKFSKI